MTATSHMLTGAVIGTAAGRPLLAVPCALLSHFVVDAMPHFGLEEENATARNKTKLFWRVVTIDVACISVLLIVLPLIVWRADSVVQLWVILTCMLAAFSPDLPWVRMFLRESRQKQNKENGPFSRFHKSIQWSETKRGIHVEYIWAAGMLLMFGVLA